MRSSEGGWGGGDAAGMDGIVTMSPPNKLLI